MTTSADPNATLWRSLADERARLRLFGPDARRYLHGMVSNDVVGLKPGQGCHAALLTVKGKLLGDLVIYEAGAAGLFIEVASRAFEKVHAALQRHLIMDDATIQDLSKTVAELGVYGPHAAALLGEASGFATESALSALQNYGFVAQSDDETATRIAATAELVMPGFHVFGTSETLQQIGERLAALGAKSFSPEEAEVLRIEAGTPLYGIDIDEDRMPAEANLDDAVSFTKGCYLGQEVVVRLRDRGHLNRRLCGLRVLDNGPPLPAGTRLRHAERPAAGNITSSVSSPRYGTIALGYIHRSVWEPGTELELIGADEQPLGRRAVVAPLPFSPRSP